MVSNIQWQYQTVHERMCNLELGQYDTYGIQANRKVLYGWEKIELIHDVTTNQQVAELLVNLFNQHQLSPIHLHDVLEDMLP